MADSAGQQAVFVCARISLSCLPSIPQARRDRARAAQEFEVTHAGAEGGGRASEGATAGAGGVRAQGRRRNPLTACFTP